MFLFCLLLGTSLHQKATMTSPENTSPSKGHKDLSSLEHLSIKRPQWCLLLGTSLHQKATMMSPPENTSPSKGHKTSPPENISPWEGHNDLCSIHCRICLLQDRFTSFQSLKGRGLYWCKITKFGTYFFYQPYKPGLSKECLPRFLEVVVCVMGLGWERSSSKLISCKQSHATSQWKLVSCSRCQGIVILPFCWFRATSGKNYQSVSSFWKLRFL